MITSSLFLTLLSLVPPSDELAPESLFPDLLRVTDDERRNAAFDAVSKRWQPWFAPALLETIRLNGDPPFERRLFSLLRDKTGQDHGRKFDAWFRWIWKQELELPPEYTATKREIYRLIDPRFERYFDPGQPAKIRLDEVRWGGVIQNGIPPLVDPALLPIGEAEGFGEDDVVFGVVLGGEARAYPKRILAWHEMVRETVGGVPLTGVYCTLCGSMIAYDSRIGDETFELGTSGCLYRSNKLMFDRRTQSLWNTLEGRPVLGPLAARDLTLERLSVVTTTFSEWKRRHPDSKILSFATGHRRDYSEGAAYRDYFATDNLMFGVPHTDTRLANKDEVLALVPTGSSAPPLALSVRYLARNPLLTETLGDLPVLILTDRSGASRVYENREDLEFSAWDRDASLVDDLGTTWKVEEVGILSPTGKKLRRLPAHRAFWFGWFAAFPNTRLVR